MRHILIFLLLASFSALAQTPGVSAYDSVDTFIGTAGGGNTFPGATLPLGMIQWSPDTSADGWYHYPDTTLRGFSLTHLSGAGCSLYADVPILPWTTELNASAASPNGFDVPFSHQHEEAHPGYYRVDLGNGVKVELTVTTRAGIGRFVFPSDAPRIFLFKAAASATNNGPHRESDSSTVQIVGNDSVTGTVHSGGFCESDSNYIVYFTAKFSQPISSYGTWPANQAGISPGSRSASGHKAGAYVSFHKSSGPILMKVGISFVSVENAMQNMDREIPGWDFEAVHAAAKKSWTQMLDRIQVDGSTPDERTIFYTGIYHSFLSPNIFSDENGEYIGFDNKVRQLPAGQTQYANFSDWDIYRSLIQFDALLLPSETSQMMQSLLRDAEQSGWLPKWPAANDVTNSMNGDAAAILLSSAYAFGARSFDTTSALHFMIKGATETGPGLHGVPERPGLRDYLNLGYVPTDDKQQYGASITLEYNSADFAVSQFAAAMGDHNHAASLLRSAQSWRKLFDPQSGFLRPRTPDGSFISGWDPDHLLPHLKGWDAGNQMGFQEGSTWQYTWMIPFNYAGLIQDMGGDQSVLPKLDKFFQKLTGWASTNFTVTNEPDFCAPYIYIWMGRPWKTQETVDRIERETFTTRPNGLPGNDDLGATSGVYVWNALGMYPVIPGVGGLVLGTPMFPRAILKFGNGSTLEITSKGSGIYVQSVKLNGKQYDSAWLPISKFSPARNHLEFRLGNKPNHSWAGKPDEYPPSFDSLRK